MTYSSTDLATAVLKELGVADANETPDAADLSYVEETYAQKWEELAAHGQELTYWHIDEIPRPVFLILRDLIMLEVSGSFGQQIDPAKKKAEQDVILSRLRRHVMVQSGGQPVKATFF